MLSRRKYRYAKAVSRIKWTSLVVAATLLAACGSDSGERVAGGALMGGAMGIPAGPIGIGVGAGVGAAAGALIPKHVLEGNAQSAQR